MALGQLGARNSIPEIVKLLTDKHVNARQYGASALGDLDAKDNIPELVVLLRDVDPQVRWYAAEALEKLSARDEAGRIAKLVEDADWRVRVAAIGVAARLWGKGAMPALKTALEEREPATRVSAASWLCVLGSTEGVPILLNEQKNLIFLNALRQPDLWRRLAEKKISGDPLGPRRGVFEAVAKQAGLEVAWPSSAKEDPWMSRFWSVWRPDRATIVDAMRGMIDSLHASSQFVAVFEPDRIEVLPRDEALKFWREWWSHQDRKK